MINDPVRGKTIKIYLPVGTVSGIRHAEIVNRTLQAIACPRTIVPELAAWSEAKRPGVYFLFGVDEQTGLPCLYIGEAEDVYDRLLNHVANKEFWNEVIFFTNKDENLTKAHAKYLESRLVQLAKEAGRYKLLNDNTPQPAMLPRGERDAMEEFIDQSRLLLGALGHRALDPLTKKIVTATETATPPSPGATTPAQPTPPATQGTVTFSMKIGRLSAKALRTDEGIVVLAGSDAKLKAEESFGDAYLRIRDNLIKQGALVEQDGKYKFVKDCLFPSPSQAASIVAGCPINGRDYWRNSAGKSLGTLDKEASKKS